MNKNIMQNRQWAFLLLLVCFFFTQNLLGQQTIPGPDRESIFQEDRDKEKENKAAKVKESLSTDKRPGEDIDFKADKVEYDKDSKFIVGTGRVVISGNGIQAQADQGKVNLDSKDSTLSGHVRTTNPDLTINSETADLNLDYETGTFKVADFTMEQGGYVVACDQMKKLSETEYHLDNAYLTTCSCADGSMPWRIKTSEANITQEGYAHTYNTTVELFGLPVMFTPYLGFPAKNERQSGLLVPTFGYGSEDGFQYKQPIFIVADDHTDFTLSPFTETRTRNGVGLDFRKYFSKYNQIESGVIYSDESPRDGSLRGTQVQDLNDPTFSDDRFGGFYLHKWRAEPGSSVPMNMIADLHYVNDDLFLREIEDNNIGKREDRYVTSKMVLRSPLGDYAGFELGGEYNQAMVEDDDLVQQRLPELGLSASRSFRPFGYNPYGLKLVPRANVLVTEFDRDTGYDGTRTDLNPSLNIPFHYKNYFNATIGAFAHQTNYNLRETALPDGSGSLDSSSDRLVSGIGGTISTALERVYDLEPGSFLRNITSLGSKSQDSQMLRVKNVIEPFTKYNFVPDTSQGENPLFDNLDRIRERSLFTYGFKTSLLGRYMPRGEGMDQIPELTPRIEELPTFSLDKPLSYFGQAEDLAAMGDGAVSRRGEIREIASLLVKQSYDYKEATDNNEPGQNALSDLGTSLLLNPTRTFALRFDSNLNTSQQDFSSWGIATQVSDDRGDALRGRYSYIENSQSQLEANLELAIIERVKAGLYTRWDEMTSDFIENQFRLRLYGSCNCWHFDLGVSDRTNPDKRGVLLSFTFGGLGDVAQGMSYNRSNNG